MSDELPKPQKSKASDDKPAGTGRILTDKEQEALERVMGTKWGKRAKLVMAVLSGLPWVGILASPALNITADREQSDINYIFYAWVQEHQIKLEELGLVVKEILSRLDTFGDRIEERLQSEEYLSLVRKAFAQWDRTDTLEKRIMLKNLLMRAGGAATTDDIREDRTRMFLHWIEDYEDLHFKVIREIYSHPEGITRHDIWMSIAGSIPQDDSEEADLFKLLVRDLSTGGVIRQPRDTDASGSFLSRGSGGRRSRSGTLKSAFDDEDLYVLTALGRSFVRYVMEEPDIQIEE